MAPTALLRVMCLWCSCVPQTGVTLSRSAHTPIMSTTAGISRCVCVHNVHPARFIATPAFHSSCHVPVRVFHSYGFSSRFPLLRRLYRRHLAGIAQPSVAYRCPTMMGLSIDVASLCTRCARTAAASEAGPRFSAIGDASVSPCYRSKYARSSRALCCVVPRTLRKRFCVIGMFAGVLM